jgi:hypothetical protein
MGGKELHILWQRVLVGAETCQRCGDTGGAVRRAAERLREELAPEGIAVRLEEKALLALTPGVIDESNRVFLNGRALEDILGAQVGQSHCQSCCDLLGEAMGGGTNCRTLVLDGAEHEALPEDLLVRAGRMAARGFPES